MNQTLDNRNLLRIVNELEDYLDLGSMTACDYNIWPLLRVSICFGLISKRYNTKSSLKAKSKRLSIINAIRSYKAHNSNKHSDSIGTLHVTNDTYLELINGTVFDRVHYGYESEEIKNNFPAKRLNLADHTLRDINDNSTELDFSQIVRIIRLVSLLYAIVIIARSLKTFQTLFGIYKFFKTRGINIAPILIKIPLKVSYACLLSGVAAKFFRRHSVTSLHHSYYYSLDSMALTLAARKCGIPVTNVQHGVQAEYHPAFGKWNNIPSAGYELLPSSFLCWDEPSINVLTKWFKSSKHYVAKLTKYHWADAWRKGEIPYNHDELKSLALNKYNVLITLQPSINGIQDIVMNCVKESTEDIRWWIRLHPRQLTNKALDEIKDSLINTSEKVFIDIASTKPLPAILSVIDLHITAFSSSVYEASYFDIPTILTHKMGLDYYSDDLSVLKASYCDTSACIMAKIMAGVESRF